MVRIVLAGLGCLLFISASTQWVDWSNQYPYAGRRVYAHTMHRTSDAVSYTHLRAHETVLDLVCRLLLKKKKTQKHYTTDSLLYKQN